MKDRKKNKKRMEIRGEEEKKKEMRERAWVL